MDKVHSLITWVKVQILLIKSSSTTSESCSAYFLKHLSTGFNITEILTLSIQIVCNPIQLNGQKGKILVFYSFV